MLNVKEVSWKVILFYLLVSTVLVSLINLVLFPSHVFSPLTRATNNWVDATLQANLLNLAVFCVFLFVFGKLRPADVGLHWHKLSQGIFLTGLLWIAMQAGILIVNWINGDIHINPSWDEWGVTVVLGGLIGQLLGNAFFEETVYRGFYLSQFFLKIKTKNEKWRTAGSILGMLTLFILSHIPNRIFSGYTLADIPLDFALLFGWGLFYTAIYLLSGNLFLAIGIHSLANKPTLITEASFPPQILLFVFTVILLVFLRTRISKPAPSSALEFDRIREL